MCCYRHFLQFLIALGDIVTYARLLPTYVCISLLGFWWVIETKVYDVCKNRVSLGKNVMRQLTLKKKPANMRANSHRCITQKVDVLKQSVDSLFR